MSNYGDMYRASAEGALIDQYCPAWAKSESRDVRLALAEGEVAKKELSELRTALQCLKRLMR